MGDDLPCTLQAVTAQGKSVNTRHIVGAHDIVTVLDFLLIKYNPYLQEPVRKNRSETGNRVTGHLYSCAQFIRPHMKTRVPKSFRYTAHKKPHTQVSSYFFQKLLLEA